jgi:hypothetical protein
MIRGIELPGLAQFDAEKQRMTTPSTTTGVATAG